MVYDMYFSCKRVSQWSFDRPEEVSHTSVPAGEILTIVLRMYSYTLLLHMPLLNKFEINTLTCVGNCTNSQLCYACNFLLRIKMI